MTVSANHHPVRAAEFRHPIAISIAVAVAMAVVLVALWLALPMSGNADHAAGHLSLAVPTFVLLALVMKFWPVPTVQAERITRVLLLTGLAVFGCALATEAVGAFGFSDSNGYEAANGLATVHDLAVIVSPIGFMMVMAGAILSVGVGLVKRRGRGTSRYLTGAVVLTFLAVVAFVSGGVIFGY